ncbi:MAG: nuclear transport factor 2 family protein, partial [Candidatus Thermoplasmatota archaeon]|nr:nuclear transport factor 2 family protein [Candidatus Thermoplasmatota archaeon]
MPASDPKVTKEIHALEHEYEHLFNTGNIDRLVDTFYAPDVRLLAPHEPILEGRKAVRKGIQEMVGSYSELRIHPGEVHVSGDLAAAQGRFSAKVSLPDGSTMEDEGKFLEVFRRQPDGQWACFLDAFSSDMAPPSMADAPATQAAEPSPVAELK